MPNKKQQKFTVLLRYPDHSTCNWPDDQVSYQVYGKDAAAALNAAIRKEMRYQAKLPEDQRTVANGDDLAMVAIYKGHCDLVAAAATGA